MSFEWVPHTQNLINGMKQSVLMMLFFRIALRGTKTIQFIECMLNLRSLSISSRFACHFIYLQGHGPGNMAIPPGSPRNHTIILRAILLTND